MIGVICTPVAADANQHVAEVLTAAAAAGAGAAALTDLVDAARTFVDGDLDVAIGGGMAEADDHGVKLKLAFKAVRVNRI